MPRIEEIKRQIAELQLALVNEKNKLMEAAVPHTDGMIRFQPSGTMYSLTIQDKLGSYMALLCQEAAKDLALGILRRLPSADRKLIGGECEEEVEVFDDETGAVGIHASDDDGGVTVNIPPNQCYGLAIAIIQTATEVERGR